MGKKILIVDDEQDILMILKTRLEGSGYDVIAAANGEEGLSKALGEKPDLIILDLMLPKVDGYWLCNIFKHDKRLPDVPIIIVSARVTKQDVDTAKDCGADAYFTKPFDSQKLLLEVSRLLKKKKNP